MDLNVEGRQASQVSAGLALVVVGVIFLGERLGWGPAWNFSQLWPLIGIGMGAVQVLLTGGRATHGYFWIFTGVVLLLDRRDIVKLGDSWPLFIVAAGLWLMFGPKATKAPNSGGGPHAD